MQSEKTIRLIEDMLAAVHAQLLQFTGGRSICSIDNHGPPSPALKYCEGKEVVLRKIVSLLHSGASKKEIDGYPAENHDRLQRDSTSAIMSSPT